MLSTYFIIIGGLLVNIDYIGVVGYGYSGSGVVFDLLREFEEISSFNFEFSLIWEPNGLLDLEKSTVDNWDFLRHDIAIKDFLRYCMILDRKGHKLGKWGLDLSNRLEIDFIEESKKFVLSICDTQYSGYTRLQDYDLSSLELFKNKILRRFFPQWSRKSNMFFSKPSEEKFLKETKQYLNNLFSSLLNKDNSKTLVLDQALPVTNMSKSMRYFDNIKCIVIDRDPRDIYVDLINKKALIGLDCATGGIASTKKYIRWHKALRENRSELSILEKNKQLLQLRFEDVIKNYNESLLKINNFLGIDFKHTRKFDYFDPALSGRNIGIWKSYKNQDEIELIKSELC